MFKEISVNNTIEIIKNNAGKDIIITRIPTMNVFGKMKSIEEMGEYSINIDRKMVYIFDISGKYTNISLNGTLRILLNTNHDKVKNLVFTYNNEYIEIIF